LIRDVVKADFLRNGHVFQRVSWNRYDIGELARREPSAIGGVKQPGGLERQPR
jgi:hypothetical protein